MPKRIMILASVVDDETFHRATTFPHKNQVHEDQFVQAASVALAHLGVSDCIAFKSADDFLLENEVHGPVDLAYLTGDDAANPAQPDVDEDHSNADYLTLPDVTQGQLNVIIAALRLWQRTSAIPLEIETLAKNGAETFPTDDEIDALVEDINLNSVPAQSQDRRS